MEIHGRNLEALTEYNPFHFFKSWKAKFRTKIRPNSLSGSYSPLDGSYSPMLASGMDQPKSQPERLCYLQWVYGKWKGLPGGAMVTKGNTCQTRRLKELGVPSLGWEDALEGKWQPRKYSCLDNPRQRSVAGYIPQSLKELDVTGVT